MKPRRNSKAATQALPQRWKGKFLDAMGKYGTVTAAARAARVSRTTAYQHKRLDPEFAAGWVEALDRFADSLEGVLFERAKAGSDLAAIFLLKAMRPEKYRERFVAVATGGVQHNMHHHLDPAALEDPTAMELARQLAERLEVGWTAAGAKRN